MVRVILLTALPLVATAVAGYFASQLRRELIQARRLYEQMEEDHAELVRKVIAANNQSFDLEE